MVIRYWGRSVTGDVTVLISVLVNRYTGGHECFFVSV